MSELYKDSTPTLDYLISISNAICGLDIRNKTRKREFAYSRILYYGLCRKYTNYSLESIGMSIGKDHSTVLHGLKWLDINVINNTDGMFSEKWIRANDVVRNIMSNNSYLKKYDMKIQFEILTKENENLLRQLNELRTKVHSQQDERILELYNQLDDEDKRFMIMKAEVTIKMKNDSRIKQEQLQNELQKRKTSGFNSYLVDGKV